MNMCAYICVSMYAYIGMCAYMYVFGYMCVYVHMCAHLCLYVYVEREYERERFNLMVTDYFTGDKEFA